MSRSIATMTIAFEQDVVAARQQTRRIASLLGFETQDQTRLATAVSEIVRNAYRYAGNGEISFVIARVTCSYSTSQPSALSLGR